VFDVATIACAWSRPYDAGALQLDVPWRAALEVALAIALVVLVIALFVSAHRSRAAEEASRRLAALVESSDDAIVSANLDGAITSWNPAAERMFGFSAAEAIGRPLSSIVPEDRTREQRLVLERVNRGELVSHFETVRRRKDGRLLDISLSISPIRDASGRIVGASKIARDITDRRDTEQRLRDRDARLLSIVDTAADGILTIDESGAIETLNPTAERLFGYAAAEVIGKNVAMLMPPPYSEEHDGYLARYLTTGEKRIIGIGREVFGRRKDGSTFHMHLSVSEMIVAGKRMFTGIARDISALKAFEAQLTQRATELARSNAELEQFAYVASHDLQEPLRMIASYAELLGRRYTGKLDADADEFIRYTVDGAARMQALIDDLLAYSRVGRRGLEFNEVDSKSCVQDALANLRLTIEQNGARIAIGDLPRVRADALQLSQLFQNLIGNAIKFRGDDPPRVEVRAQARDGHWLFSVRDNGIGIEPEHSERVFVVFQRLHARQRYPGNGIGLAICKKIVERHGGRIWLESEPGRGTTFFFTLPDRRAEDA
jgi:PAS domain S-box-containing protein